jgi:hypothetical protein
MVRETADQEGQAKADDLFDGWMLDARQWIAALEQEAASDPKAFYRGCGLGLGRQVVIRAALRKIDELRSRVAAMVRA